MNSRFAHFFLAGFFLFSLALAALPQPAAAGLIPCGRTPNLQNANGDPDLSTAINESDKCTICHVIIGGQGIMNWGLKVMTYIAITVIVAMAVMYIVSAGDNEMMTTAKGGIKASLVGFAIMLGAWLIINTTLRIFSANISGLTVTNGGFGFSCDLKSNSN